MEHNVQLQPKLKPDSNANTYTRSQSQSSSQQHESIAYIKGGVPIKRITATAVSPSPAKPSLHKNAKTGLNKSVPRVPLRPILKMGPAHHASHELQDRQALTKELFHRKVPQQESCNALSQKQSQTSTTSKVHHIRNPLSSINLLRARRSNSGLDRSQDGEIALHHTNPFLTDLVKESLPKSVQSVHAQTQTEEFLPVSNSGQEGRDFRFADLAPLLPSNERLSLDKSAQIYSWIPSPLANYLDPLVHKTAPSYRLDPDLSREADFWDKPPDPPADLPDCFVDSKSMDAFMTHVLSGGGSSSSHTTGSSFQKRTQKKQKGKKKKPPSPSDSSQPLSESPDSQPQPQSQSPVLPVSGEVRPRSSSNVSTHGSTATDKLSCFTPAIHISFNYTPVFNQAPVHNYGFNGFGFDYNDWEARKSFQKRSAYFPGLFRGTAGEKSSEKAACAEPATTTEAAVAPISKAPTPTPEGLPQPPAAAELELPIVSDAQASSTSLDSQKSAAGIRNVVLSQFLQEIPPYSASRPQDKTSSLVSEASDRTYTKELDGDDTGGAADKTKTCPENQLPECTGAESEPIDQLLQKRNADSNIFIGTISEEELLQYPSDDVEESEAHPTGSEPDFPALNFELERASRALLEQPALVNQLSQVFLEQNSELTLGQRICAIIDMSNDKSSRLGRQLMNRLQQLNGARGGASRPNDSRIGNEIENLSMSMESEFSDARSTTSTYILSGRRDRRGDMSPSRTHAHVHFSDSKSWMSELQSQSKNRDRRPLSPGRNSSSYVVSPRSSHDIHNLHCSAGSEYAMLAAAAERKLEEIRLQHQHQHVISKEHGGDRGCDEDSQAVSVSARPHQESRPRVRAARSRSTPSKTAIQKVLAKIQESASRMTTPQVPSTISIATPRRSRSQLGRDRDRERERPSSQRQQRRP